MWQAEKVKEDAVIFTWMKVISVLVNSYILLCLSSFVSFMSPFSSSCEAFRSSASFSPATRSETSRSPEPCWPPAPAITTRTDTRPWWVQEQHFFVLSSRKKAFVSPLLEHRDCLTLLLFFLLHLIIVVLIISPFFPSVTSLPDVMHPSSSHPLNHSLRPPPPPLCPGSSSRWRWWTGSAPRGTTGTTTAHRGTTRATGPLRRWTRTPVSRWDRPLCRPPSDTSWLRVGNRMSKTQTKIWPLKLRSLDFSWHATSNF